MTPLATRLFGAHYRIRRNDYASLREVLIKADMHVSVEQWLSHATLYAFVIAALFFPLLVAVSRFAFGYFLVFDIFRNLSSFQLIDLGRLLGEFSLLLLFLAIPYYIGFLSINRYPWLKVWERQRKIEGHLPHAIGWMASLATVGIIPYEIFRKLSQTEEYYGEVSLEAKRLVRDVEVLGYDFMTALRNLSSSTPSPRLRTFLQGAITSAVSGGEMGNYFVGKARENMEENRRKFADFIATLGMLSELYITGMVAGPLFIIVMFSVMLMMSGASPALLKIIIYGAIPGGSMMFVLLTDAMTPEGMKN